MSIKSSFAPIYECCSPGVINDARQRTNETARQYRKGGSHESPAFYKNPADDEIQFQKMKALMDDEARFEKNKKVMAANASRWTKEDHAREEEKFQEAKRTMQRANAAPNEPSYHSQRKGVSKQPDKKEASKQVFPKPYYFQ